MPEGLRIAGFYGRVSADDDESIANQLTVARECALRDGYRIPDGHDFIFQDVNVSGVTVVRGGFGRLERAVEAKSTPFDRVYVRGSDRLGRWRNVRLYDYYTVRFQMHGVSLRFCDTTRHLDFSDGTSDDDFGLYLASKVDEFKNAKNRTELVRAMRRGARAAVFRGHYLGASPPFGLDKALVDAQTKEVVHRPREGERTQIEGCIPSLRAATDRRRDSVRFIFNSLDRGRSTRWVAGELNTRGYPAMAKGFWTSNNVSNVARNPIYAGVMMYGGKRDPKYIMEPPEFSPDGSKPVVVLDFYPDPPVSREQFLRVQDKLQGRDSLQGTWRRRTESPYLLTGKIRCALCRRCYAGCGRGGPYQYYRHSISEYRDCIHTLFSVPLIEYEDRIMALLKEVVTDTNLEARVREELERRLTPDPTGEASHEIARLQTQISENTRALAQLQTALERVQSSAAIESITRRMDSLGDLIAQCQVELERRDSEVELIRQRLAQSASSFFEEGQLASMLDSGTFEVQRALVERVLEYIEIDPVSLEVTVALRYA